MKRSSRPELARSLDEARTLRGLSRPAPHVRPGADVPDRRAHPVRARCRPSRPARPSRGSPMLRSARCIGAVEDDVRRKPRPHPRPADRAAGARQARRPRDDGDAPISISSSSTTSIRSIRNPDGARPLYGAQYFARLTQRLISALSSQTNYGALYQVDMRLRPSGRSGPVATSIDAFASYQESEAWTWEHMALTRARVVSAPPAFAARVESGDPGRAVPRSATRGGRRRRGRDARGDRQGEGRGRALGPQIRRRRAGRHRVHRAISAARSRGASTRKSSTPRRRACSTRRGGSGCWRPRMPTCCGRRRGSITI